MERLCQEIVAAHEKRQELLAMLRSEFLRLRSESSRNLQEYRKHSQPLRGELQAAKKDWQMAATFLAKKRRHSAKRGPE